MDEPVRIGVIGCGVIGKTHAATAAELEETELVAVADLNEEAARSVAAEHGGPKVYARAGDLLDDPDVEAVVLALPACARTDLCVAAFKKGKHVLNEKPMALNVAEAERMVAAQGKNKAACCVSRLRFAESAAAAEDFIASGALGDLRVIRVRAMKPVTAPTSPPPVWRYRKDLNAGGIMSNWGCYDLDYILGVLKWQLKPVRVLGTTWAVQSEYAEHIAPGSDAETHIAVTILCEGGTVILYERGEQVARQDEYIWEMTGATGTLHFAITPNQGKTMTCDRFVPGEGVISETVWQGDEDWRAAHAGPLRDLTQAIRSGREPRCSFEQALLIQKITEAIYTTSETGQAVDII